MYTVYGSRGETRVPRGKTNEEGMRERTIFVIEFRTVAKVLSRARDQRNYYIRVNVRKRHIYMRVNGKIQETMSFPIDRCQLVIVRFTTPRTRLLVMFTQKRVKFEIFYATF